MGTRRSRTRIACVLALLAGAACASAPPALSPSGVAAFQANRVVVAIGTAQHAAIALNGTVVCGTPGDTATCQPLLSEANTRSVVEAVTDALTAIRQVPAGWRPTALAALDRIERRLDAAGLDQLRPYLVAVRAVLGGQEGP